MKFIRQTACLLLSACFSAAATSATEERLQGPTSAYGLWLEQLHEHWPANRPTVTHSANVVLRCIATPGDDRYVGIVQHMFVGAALSTVESVLDDVAHYKDIFPDVVDVQIVPGNQRGQHYLTAWEQRVPVFFLPHVKYQLEYLVDKSKPTVSIYRYSLRHLGQMKSSDGMIVLEAVGSGMTRFTEYDFFNADWGPLGASTVWRQSLRGAFLSDGALKLRAEYPDWSYARIAEKAQHMLESESEQVDACLRNRKPVELGN